MDGFPEVVYRSWTFGFGSGIPRVTTSSRVCDRARSRGLHLFVSEPGYTIIGTVSEVSWHPLLILPLKMWFWLNDLNNRILALANPYFIAYRMMCDRFELWYGKTTWG
ncbi:hypothetical protein GQ457_11G025070 [Hibiscus cannabinus]